MAASTGSYIWDSVCFIQYFCDTIDDVVACVLRGHYLPSSVLEVRKARHTIEIIVYSPQAEYCIVRNFGGLIVLSVAIYMEIITGEVFVDAVYPRNGMYYKFINQFFPNSSYVCRIMRDSIFCCFAASAQWYRLFDIFRDDGEVFYFYHCMRMIVSKEACNVDINITTRKAFYDEYWFRSFIINKSHR